MQAKKDSSYFLTYFLYRAGTYPSHPPYLATLPIHTCSFSFLILVPAPIPLHFTLTFTFTFSSAQKEQLCHPITRVFITWQICPTSHNIHHPSFPLNRPCSLHHPLRYHSRRPLESSLFLPAVTLGSLVQPVAPLDPRPNPCSSLSLPLPL